FKTQKEYLLDKNRFSRSEEAKREQEYIAMKNSEEIKWYEATVNSNKFDELKAWNLTFEDDFTDGKVDESKWMNSFFMGKMMLNDRYVLANEKQYFTDNKNVDIKNSVLSIVTKKEKATGKVWDAKLGFMTKDFDYTSGMLSTANSFRQQYGRFEAKIRINSEAPVYQAFWLKGEHKEPEIDIFKYNIKKGQMQLSAYNKGAAAGNKFGGSGLAKDFFIYTVDWDASKITWKINGYEVASASNNINEPLFIMLSAGLNQAADNLPAAMQIDWVRCYEKA
ncbi:MAG: glycoside hydrolase family 16 protein, partial [Salinivirgaceae bacterium]|nr:glycoside hydrolase family 16 protein [Salinivirgaceae bacterium]